MQTLRTHSQATLLDIGKRSENSHEAQLSLGVRPTLFRIWRWISLKTRNAGINLDKIPLAFVCISTLEGEVVRYPEYPATQVSARSTEVQMPKEGKKHLLNDLLRVRNGYTERN
jgi:hypothetical protein